MVIISGRFRQALPLTTYRRFAEQTRPVIPLIQSIKTNVPANPYPIRDTLSAFLCKNQS